MMLLLKSITIFISMAIVLFCPISMFAPHSISNASFQQMPVGTSEVQASEVVIDGATYTVGNSELQDYLNNRDSFVHDLHFLAPSTDINVIYLLNATRVTLKEENVLTIQGVDIDRLVLELKSKPNLPTYFGLVSFSVSGGKLSQAGTNSFLLETPLGTASVTIIPVANDSGTVVTVNGVAVASGAPGVPLDVTNGETIVIGTVAEDGTAESFNILVSETDSLSANIAYRSFYFKTDSPQSNCVKIFNTGDRVASFQMNLNDAFFLLKNELLNTITSAKDEFENEPIERKVWRFIRDNRYHWHPITTLQWKHDPTLYFNSLGFGYCGEAASLYYQFMTALGFEARVWDLNGHVVAEVKINGRWELYDPDLELYYYNRNEDIAGVEELAFNPDLITNPVNPTNVNAWPYSSTVANIYATLNDNYLVPWYETDPVQNYLLQFKIPPSGAFEFPYIFASPLHTIFTNSTPKYTNARLVIPQGSPFDVDIPLVIHTIVTPTISPVSQLSIATDMAGSKVTFKSIASGGSGYYEYKFALCDPGTGICSVVQADSVMSSWTWETVGLPLGTYKIQVWAKTAGSTSQYEVHAEQEFTLKSLVSAVAVVTDLPSPQLIRDSITFNATAFGGSGSYEYYFALYNPNTVSWSDSQAYSSTSSWTWQTAGLSPGTYSIQVWARNAGSTARYEVYKSCSYTLIPPVAAVAVTSTPPSPQSIGTNITFNATASGGGGNYEYYFALRNPATGTWSDAQAYSNKGTWLWDTTGCAPGVYAVQVWVRNAGTNVKYDTVKQISYAVVPPASQLNVTIDKASPQVVGKTISFTASASGGGGSYEYYFALRNPATGTWSDAQAYSANGTWLWDTTGSAPCVYAVQVWARNAGTNVPYDTFKQISYTVVAPVSQINVTVDKASPQVVGKAVTISASASGGGGSYEYYFALRNPATGTWSDAQAYSKKGTWLWDTTGYAPGVYAVQVWVRNAGTIVTYDTVKQISYTVVAPASQLDVSVDKASPQVVGKSVTISTSASGGGGSYEYYFALRNPSTGTWSDAQPYSANGTWLWDTTGYAPGVYAVQVWVRNAGTNVSYDLFKQIEYALTPQLM